MLLVCSAAEATAPPEDSTSGPRDGHYYAGLQATPYQPLSRCDPTPLHQAGKPVTPHSERSHLDHPAHFNPPSPQSHPKIYYFTQPTIQPTSPLIPPFIPLHSPPHHPHRSIHLPTSPSSTLHLASHLTIQTTSSPILPSKTFHPHITCLLYTSPSPRDRTTSRMPSSA